MIAMTGWRKCAACGKELPEECFRVGDSECRQCARALRCRIANGITAQPKEAWALDLLKRIGAL